MRHANPADNFLESIIDYDKYARMYTRDDFSHEQKVEAVKLIEIMVLEALEHYYPDESFKRSLLRAKAEESGAESQTDCRDRYSRTKKKAA